MLCLNRILSAAALLLLLNACGTSSKDNHQTPHADKRSANVDTPNASQVEAKNPGDIPSGFVQSEAADGQSLISCAYSINGKSVKGNSQEECDLLKKDFEKAVAASVPPAPGTPSTPAASPSGSTQVSCSFNINGKLYQGSSQAECDKLKKDLGISVNIPSTPIPAPKPEPAPSQGSNTNYACAFNINGKLYEGKSKEECDKLKKDLGFQF